MADDTDLSSETPTGSADDISIVKSAPRKGGLDAVVAYQGDQYRSALQSQILQRQHRTALASMGTIPLPNDISGATIPAAAGAYSQADIQVMVNELAALKVVVAQLSTIVAFWKQTLTDNVVKPSS